MLYRGWIKKSPLKATEYFGADTHWDSFETTRRKHNDNICSETNKLVLRLDKLINPPESLDEKKINDLDKSLVEWTLDDLVKLCPYCAKSFTIARRRHHCRVCGAILCNNCSKFLEYKAACKLVKPAKLYTDPYDRIEDQLQNRDAAGRPDIRTCEDCKRLLDRRIRTIVDHYDQPTFLDFYEKLRKTIGEADELIISQSSISSNAGERQTSLELKNRIHDLRKSVAKMSITLNKLIEREKPTGRQAFLIDAIRQSIGYWLKENLDSKINRVHGYQDQTSGSKASGWVSEQRCASLDDTSPDANPLLIQIKNLEEYIRQAKLADRYEEVSVLEANKRDLEIEYFIQQDVSTSSLSMADYQDEASGNVSTSSRSLTLGADGGANNVNDDDEEEDHCAVHHHRSEKDGDLGGGVGEE